MPYHAEEFNSLNSVFNQAASDLLDDDGSINNLQGVLDAYNALIGYSLLG